MLESLPSETELKNLLGDAVHEAWQAVVAHIGENYLMDSVWDSGRKAGKYELKFRRSGKTLCALYARDGVFGFMVIYGGKEREIFDSRRNEFPEAVLNVYDATRTYHDGKWIMIDVADSTLLPTIRAMIAIKKKPRAQSKK